MVRYMDLDLGIDIPKREDGHGSTRLELATTAG